MSKLLPLLVLVLLSLWVLKPE